MVGIEFLEIKAPERIPQMKKAIQNRLVEIALDYTSSLEAQVLELKQIITQKNIDIKEYEEWVKQVTHDRLQEKEQLRKFKSSFSDDGGSE